MTRPFAESAIERGPNPVRVEDGRIINVNMRRWTADVRTRSSGRVYLDIQWSNPYFHFAAGEGIFFMPEVGSRVKVCRPSDSDPFIMCFITPFERPARQGEESPVGTNPTESNAGEGGSDITYRAGRPYLQQGDIMLRTRDHNSIWLRRGGVIEIGSTAISKRIYIPLLNYIRDICENYSMWSAGGVLTWTVARSDTDPDDDALAVLNLAVRNAAQDEMATVGVQIGHVDDSKRLRFVIAPEAINTRTFEVTGTAVYTLEIDDEGSVTETLQKDYTLNVQGDLDWTITGNATARYSSDLTEEISGNQSTKVTGTHRFEAANSTERVTGSKVVECNNIQLGGSGAVMPVALVTPALVTFLVGHTHPVVGGGTGPPVNVLLPDMFQARNVRGQ